MRHNSCFTAYCYFYQKNWSGLRLAKHWPVKRAADHTKPTHAPLCCPPWHLLQGKAIGVNGWWPSKAVTFIENHDTGSTQQHWPFPSEHVAMGYAYILTHPGACVSSVY